MIFLQGLLSVFGILAEVNKMHIFFNTKGFGEHNIFNFNNSELLLPLQLDFVPFYNNIST